MPKGVPYVTFSLHPEKEALLVSSLSQDQIDDDEDEESTLCHLEMLNGQGLDEAAMLLGKHILGLLRLSNPERFDKYQNLVFEIPKGPTGGDLAKASSAASREGTSS